jgi:LPXTG-site transpeptidase (sortase) family protein
MLSYSAGVVLTGFFAVQIAQGEVERRQGIAGFEETVNQFAVQQAEYADAAKTQAPSGQVAMLQSTVPPSLNPQEFDHLPTLTDAGDPDTTLWAPSRIADYQRSLDADLPSVLGVLEVPSVDLKVPVYSVDTDLTMDRGSGIIDGMAFPHESGNIGISGHRDGYFRALKDIEVGDKIILQTLEGPKHFVVDAAHIVEISDTSLLQDTQEQTVTLVTCYPFYFVGHAPQRFIVTASLDTTNVNQN